MENYLAVATFFLAAWTLAWYYIAADKRIEKILSDRILQLENNFKDELKKLRERVNGINESVDAQRTIFMSQKVAHGADILELQRAFSRMRANHIKISKHQNIIKGMIEAKATLVPYEVKQIERGH